MDDNNNPNVMPEVTPEVMEAMRKDAALSALRARLDAGYDPKTREGVISDVAAVLVVGLASVVKAIAAGKDLAAVRAAVVPLQPFADAVLGTLATPEDLADPAAAIAAGKTVFPYQVKGDAARVVGDMQRLANGVSQALSQART